MVETPSSPDEQAQPDKEVFRRAGLAQKPQLLDSILSKYYWLYVSLAQDLVEDRDEALIIVQEACVRIIQACMSLTPVDNFKSWSCGIVRNLARDCIRDRTRKKQSISLDSQEVADLQSPLVLAETSVESHERNVRIREEVSQLPEPERQIVELYHFTERKPTLQQIGNMLVPRIPRSNVEYYLKKAHRTLSFRLRDLMEE